MLRRQHAGMRKATHQGFVSRLAITGMFICLIGIVCARFGVLSVTSGHPARGAFRSVLHWRNAEHDWLFVVDDKTHEVEVYNAVDGRPLGRMDSLQKSLVDSTP